jgi:hypothetical protein
MLLTVFIRNINNLFTDILEDFLESPYGGAGESGNPFAPWLKKIPKTWNGKLSTAQILLTYLGYAHAPWQALQSSVNWRPAPSAARPCDSGPVLYARARATVANYCTCNRPKSTEMPYRRRLSIVGRIFRDLRK